MSDILNRAEVTRLQLQVFNSFLEAYSYFFQGIVFLLQQQVNNITKPTRYKTKNIYHTIINTTNTSPFLSSIN